MIFRILHTIFCLLAIINGNAQQFEYSQGLYRVPYSNNTIISVVSDVWNHSPKGCLDIRAHGCTDCGIVAAAGGWIRAIRDFNTAECGGDNCCPEFNNFIILEHPNGEWSSYIHLRTGSITALSHRVGNWVNSGTLLGYEGSVGCSTGPHLHLEVSRPNDNANAWDNFDGVLRRHGTLLNPVICSIANGLFLDNQSYIAAACSYNCPENLTLTGNVTTSGSIRRADNSIGSTQSIPNTGVGMYRAGSMVVLNPGFTATEGSIVTAQIKSCNQQN